MFDIPFLRRLVILNGIVPLFILGWDAWFDRLGANRVNYAIHITGILALVFLVLSLAVTPLKAITGWQTLIAYRRSLGLYGFFYVGVHLALYVVFDRAGNLRSAFEEFISRRYLQVGLVSFTLMVPLALTSTNGMIQRLGPRRWKLLHRLAYVAIPLGGLHYLLLVKSDIRQPVAFLAVIGTLLVGRLGTGYLDRRRRAIPTKGLPQKVIEPAADRPRPRPWKGQLRLAKIFPETHDIRTFRFVPPNGGPLPFDFQPGQFLNIKLPLDGRSLTRSYTIASSPSRRDYCEITVKREPHGRGSRFIHEVLREGDLVDIHAPAGKFYFSGEHTREVVLIAGGVGMTPIMAMLRYLTDIGWPGTIHLVFVARTIADYVFREEMEYLARRFMNFHLHVTLTREENLGGGNSAIGVGRLSSERLLGWIPNLPSLPVFLCGPVGMMDDTRQLLVSAGVANDAIHTEAFSPKTAKSTNEIEAAESLNGRHLNASPNAKEGGTKHLLLQGQTGLLEIEDSETVLECVERNGIEIPYECRSGVCGQCKVQLCQGKVRMDQSYALSPKEREQGWILACQSHLETDAEINVSPSHSRLVAS